MTGEEKCERLVEPASTLYEDLYKDPLIGGHKSHCKDSAFGPHETLGGGWLTSRYNDTCYKGFSM